MRCGRAACRGTSSASAPRRRSRRRSSPPSRTPRRACSPAASSSAWRSPARSSLAPEVLFLDEPTANLDPASTVAIERLIQDAHERRHQDRAGHPRRRPGAPPGRRDRLPVRRPARGPCPGRPVLRRAGLVPRARLSRGPNRHLETKGSTHVPISDASSWPAALALRRPGAGRRRAHHHPVDHLDRGVRPVRPHPADLRGRDRHRCARRRGRHRPGAQERPELRRRRAVRARQAGRARVRRGRLRRRAART